MTRGPRLLPQPVGVDLAERTSPPDWSEVFGFDGPLELEIGSGKGGHALEYAARHPHVRYVAFEWRKKYARDVQHRADQLGLKNLRVVEGDARIIVPRIFAKESLDWVRLQFPDPWWKRKQQHRTIIRGEFVNVSPAMKGVTPADMAQNFGMPYHPGAEKYYKEAGLLK